MGAPDRLVLEGNRGYQGWRSQLWSSSRERSQSVRQMLSETEATGLWYLEDKFWVQNHKMYTTGTVLYWDRYVKENGRWLIRETSYERIYEFTETLDEAPKPDSHYLAVHGTEPQF